MAELIQRTKLEVLNEILKDPDRKSLFRIVYEFFYLFFIYRELPKHYISRYLFKKGVSNIKDYLPNKFLSEIPSRFNEKRVKEVLDNKLYFHLFYSQFNIRLPKILLYNHKRMFVYGNKSVEINSLNDFSILLEETFKQNPSYDSIIIKKTYASSSGRKIFKLFTQQLRTDLKIVSEIFEEVTRSEFLFQETIKQHPEIDKLNTSSLNTIRIDTFIDGNGNIDIISAHIRMSTNNYHIDNISSGGCFVGISLQTGELRKFGYSLIKTRGGNVLKEHPTTNAVFENVRIPFFPEVKELVIKAAGLMPELRLIGWDVAVSESGPILIEGNSDYEIRGNDFADGGYLANSTFRKVLHEINYI